MSEHPQAAILRAIAEDGKAKIEVMDSTTCPPTWFPASLDYVLNLPSKTYRIAPKQHQPDADGWIKWEGGLNPVPGRRVDYRFRNGDEYFDLRSNVLTWWHDDRACGADIIAYRIVKPKREKVYYLWVYPGSSQSKPDNDYCMYSDRLYTNAPVPNAIRLDWSRTMIPQEGK